MVQRASSEAAPSGGHRESRLGLGIGYAAYQSGYNKLFTQVIKGKFYLILGIHVTLAIIISLIRHSLVYNRSLGWT